MTNLIALLVLLIILGGAAWYLYREKKRGAACIGCPYAKTCAKSRGGCCGSGYSAAEE